MLKKLKYRIAIFFAILFMAVLSTPTIILSFDNTADVSILYNINDEEEKENLKLVFKDIPESSENLIFKQTDFSFIRYTFKTYSKPYLNLIIPPPEFI